MKLKRIYKRFLSLLLVMAMIVTSIIWNGNTQIASAAENEDNLVLNGDFSESVEDGPMNWSFLTNDGSAGSLGAVPSEGGEVHVTAPGQNPWSIQLFQDIAGLGQGQTYQLSIDLTADVATNVKVILQEQVGFTSAIEEIIALEANTPKSVELSSTALNSNMASSIRLGIMFGNTLFTEEAHVKINNVKLVKEGGQTDPPPKPVSGPVMVISEDAAHNIANGSDAVVLKFHDDGTFGNGISSIIVNDAEQFNTNATVSIDGANSTITLAAALFGGQAMESKNYVITVKSEGYGDSVVNQMMYQDQTWNLVWNDEFDGSTLDATKWDYQTGTGSDYGLDGWGNNEQEYYQADNLTVADGKMTIEAKADSNNPANKPYTSARIRTMKSINDSVNPDGKLYAKKYGKIEAKIKMPIGSGFWPAFWMLPVAKDNPYGQWAASGEIDIMEARGRQPDTVDGTIHYGGYAPQNAYSGGHHTWNDGNDITGYHVYSLEWEPTEMRWYCDGELFYKANNWYSRGVGEAANYAYPAPFDQEFYILFNLAVGGNYDGGVMPAPSDLPAKMEVDYVRVYDKEGGYDEENIEEPPVEKDTSPEAQALIDDDQQHNYVRDINFDTLNLVPSKDGAMDSTSDNWYSLAMTEFGGAATVSKQQIGGSTFAKIDVTSTGNQTYSVQLIQHVPLVKGYTYELTFDAKADSARTLTTKFGGNGAGPNGWGVYSSVYEPELGTDVRHYSTKFVMGAGNTDPTARLEFNLSTATGPVYIGNVALKLSEIKETDGQDDPKEPLSTGNHVYNDKFSLGSNRLLFWHGSNADLSVVAGEANVNPTGGQEASLYQLGMNFLQGDTYHLKFQAAANTGSKTVTARLTNADGDTVYATKAFTIDDQMKDYELDFTMDEAVTDKAAKIEFLCGTSGLVKLDNVFLSRTTNHNIDYTDVDFHPVYNGDFFNGTDGWNIWSESGAAISSSAQTGALVGDTVSAANHNFWAIGVQSSAFYLKKGITYKLSFDINGSVAKKVHLQLGSGEPWLIDEVISLKQGKQTIEREVTPQANLAGAAFTLFLAQEAGTYHFTLDNVDISVQGDIPAGNAQPVSLAPNAVGMKAGEDVVLKFSELAGWSTAEKTVYVNEVAAAANLVHFSGNTITIDKSLFQTAGVYKIKVKAEGYSATKPINITLLDPSGDLLVNGAFDDGADGWGAFFQNGCGDSAVENGKMKVTHTWNEGDDWNIQLFQDNIPVTAGDYILKFDAYSDVSRPIAAQLQIGNDIIPGTQIKLDLGTSAKTYYIIWKGLSDIPSAKLDFPMGNVTNGSLMTPASGHHIYMDNFSLKKASAQDIAEVEEILQNTQPPVLASKGPVTLGSSAALTYSNNPVWSAKERTVYIDDEAVPSGKVSFDNNTRTITIDKSCFTAIGVYSISVAAVGFEGKTNAAAQRVLGTDGNLLFNGDFENEDYWTMTDEDAGCSQGSIGANGYTLNYIKGIYHQEWGVPVIWASQLIQGGIVTEAGKTYRLTFHASTTTAFNRPIIIEMQDAGQTVQKTIEISGSDMNSYGVDVTPGASENFEFKFLLGAIGDDLQQFESDGVYIESPHTLVINHVAFRESQQQPTPTPTSAPTPTTPSNPSGTSAPSPAPSSPIKTGDAEITVNIDSKNGQVKAEVVPETKGSVIDHKAELTMSLPEEDIVKAAGNATAKNPLIVEIKLPNQMILDQLQSKDVKEVALNVVVPSNLGSNIKLADIVMDQTLFVNADEQKKRIVTTISDETGKAVASWAFDTVGPKLDTQRASDVKLNINVASAKTNKTANQLLSKDKNNSKGIVLSFSQKTMLPAQAQIKVFIGSREGLKAGGKAYVYRVNSKTGMYEEVKGLSSAKLDAQGYLTMNILKGDTYAVLPHQPEKSIRSAYTNQIGIAKTLTITAGKNTSVRVTLPDTAIAVQDFKDTKATIPSAVEKIVIRYYTEDPSIATVDRKTGKITAKKAGKVTFRTVIETAQGATKSFITKVTVKK